MNSSNITNGDENHHGLDASPTSSNNEIGMTGVGDGKTAGQPLSDFLLQLEDYTPTVRNVDSIIYLAYPVIIWHIELITLTFLFPDYTCRKMHNLPIGIA
jgi:hypothetical protein